MTHVTNVTKLVCKLRRMCQITDAASSSSRPSAPCSFQIERSITFALLELFPSYSHGANEQLSVTLGGTRGNGGVCNCYQELYSSKKVYLSRKFGNFFFTKFAIAVQFGSFVSFCEVRRCIFTDSYSPLGVSRRNLGPHCCSPGCLVLSAPFGPRCCSPGCLVVCRRRLARVLQPWLLRCLSVPLGPHCCSPGCLVVCRRRLARVAAALAASLSVGAVWPALLQPWLLRCLSAPFGPRC